MNRETHLAIIDSGGEVSGVAGTSLPTTLNLVLSKGIEPTSEESSVLLRAAEEYTRTVRAITKGWVARIPKPEGMEQSDIPMRRSTDLDG